MHSISSQRRPLAPQLPGRILAFLVLTATALVAAPAAQAQPTFSKAFEPASIGPGSASRLVFTFANESGSPVTDLAFTDDLPTGMTLADPAIPSTDCSGATLSAPDGGTTITFSGASLPANSSCTAEVFVTSSTAGIHSNTSGDLTSSAGNSGTASADLTVAIDRPGFSKGFAPALSPLGSRAALALLALRRLAG